MSDINQVTKNLGIKLYDATDEPGLIAGYVTAMTKLDEAASKAGIDQAARAMAAAADVKATTADGKAVAAADAASIADGKATTAATTAEAAATAAATADAKAVAADTKATQAIADAATADGKAVAADTKADTATTAAATADGKAVVADGKAEAAATAAATADAKAVAAQSRADAAYALAEAAGGIPPLKQLSESEIDSLIEWHDTTYTTVLNKVGCIINIDEHYKFVSIVIRIDFKASLSSGSNLWMRGTSAEWTSDNVTFIDLFPQLDIEEHPTNGTVRTPDFSVSLPQTFYYDASTQVSADRYALVRYCGFLHVKTAHEYGQSIVIN